MYVKSTFVASCALNVTIPQKCEILVLGVTMSQNVHVFVAGVYRPPAALVDVMSTIAEHLEKCLSSELMVLGDFNLDYLTHLG